MEKEDRRKIEECKKNPMANLADSINPTHIGDLRQLIRGGLRFAIILSFILAIALWGCGHRVTDQSEIEKLIEHEPYSFEGESLINIDGRSFELEDLPESIVEETVMKDFLYSITADFDSKYNILADLKGHNISIENEKKLFGENVYTQSYTIHKISTLSEDEFNNDTSFLYYYGWKDLVDKYNLLDYKVVNVEYTVTLSEKAIALGPQYGEGTFSRNFIVGKTSVNSSYKIYDFGMPLFIDP